MTCGILDRIVANSKNRAYTKLLFFFYIREKYKTYSERGGLSGRNRRGKRSLFYFFSLNPEDRKGGHG